MSFDNEVFFERINVTALHLDSRVYSVKPLRGQLHVAETKTEW